jgi:hypothetical protein
MPPNLANGIAKGLAPWLGWTRQRPPEKESPGGGFAPGRKAKSQGLYKCALWALVPFRNLGAGPRPSVWWEFGGPGTSAFVGRPGRTALVPFRIIRLGDRAAGHSGRGSVHRSSLRPDRGRRCSRHRPACRSASPRPSSGCGWTPRGQPGRSGDKAW